MTTRDHSGQISSRVPHTGPDFPQKVAFRKGDPYFTEVQVGDFFLIWPD